MSNKNQVVQGAIGFTAAAAVILTLGWTTKDYLDLPVLGFDQSDECVWIETVEDGEVERRVCPVVLPTRYEHVYVWSDDSKGSQHDYN